MAFNRLRFDRITDRVSHPDTDLKGDVIAFQNRFTRMTLVLGLPIPVVQPKPFPYFWLDRLR